MLRISQFVFAAIFIFCSIWQINLAYAYAGDSVSRNSTSNKKSLQLPAVFSLDGDWNFSVIDGAVEIETIRDEPEVSQNVKTLAVPKNWYLAGIEHSGAAVYQRQFLVPAEYVGQTAVIEFEGVDYQAAVWINGQFVGHHTGYFAPFSFDITSQVKSGTNNRITVLVNSPREDASSWSQWKRLIKGVLSHHDTRPGGAWSEAGQDANTGGIWAPVKLRFTGSTRVTALQIFPDILDGSKTQARIRITLLGETASTEPLRFRAVLKAANFQGASVEKTIVVDKPLDGIVEFSMPPHLGKLWWPKQLGFPSLYQLELEVWQGSKILDRISDRFGYRKLDFNSQTGEWRLNGTRLFLKGTNYIPSQWLSEMSKADYVQDIALMQDAYINAVRVHAVVVSKQFYEAADEAGMLVWQDFPLQWGYTDEKWFELEAQRQAADMVRTLFNNPAIIAWSMHNEPPWDAWWMKYKYPQYNPQQNKELTNAVYQTVKAIDPTRHAHAFSATGEHTWQGWYSGHWRDFEKPTRQVLITEFGAQALPNLSSLQKLFGSGAVLWPDSAAKMEIWKYHNFQPDETFKNAQVNMGSNIEEFISNTQKYQSNLVRVAAESYRRQKYNPVGAIFQFMFVEDWPSINWGIVDYWRNPKPGFAALKQAYQPVLASFAGLEPVQKVGEAKSYPVWIVNDLREELRDCELQIELRMGSKAVAEARYVVEVAADSAQHVIDWTAPPLSKGTFGLTARVVQAGKVLSLNSVEITAHD